MTIANAVAAAAVLALVAPGSAAGGELTVDDFRLDGPLGSAGTVIEKLGPEHFRATLGHAPNKPAWCNKLQFEILRNAGGKRLRMDVRFPRSNAYRFNEYFHSFSYDGRSWQPVHWQKRSKNPKADGDTLVFPRFTADRVIVGHQVPMSYEDVVARMARYGRSRHVRVRILGLSLGGRALYRMELTGADGEVPRARRWVHYFANQHPGECNSQWRMVGMIDWLLSDAGRDARRRSLCHFILMMSPDAPTHGWYRTNAEGLDMNRTYRREGADPAEQTHEACIYQKDLEALMGGDCPPTSVWSMHTWGGTVDPLILPGPEMTAERLGDWKRFREVLDRCDPDGLIRPLRISSGRTPGTWANGPHRQFGITTVLCEGAGSIDTRSANVASGAALMKAIAACYRGTRPAGKRGP